VLKTVSGQRLEWTKIKINENSLWVIILIEKKNQYEHAFRGSDQKKSPVKFNGHM